MRREFHAKRKFIGDKLGSRSVRGAGEIALVTQCLMERADLEEEEVVVEDEEDDEEEER